MSDKNRTKLPVADIYKIPSLILNNLLDTSYSQKNLGTRQAGYLATLVTLPDRPTPPARDPRLRNPLPKLGTTPSWGHSPCAGDPCQAGDTPSLGTPHVWGLPLVLDPPDWRNPLGWLPWVVPKSQDEYHAHTTQFRGKCYRKQPSNSQATAKQQISNSQATSNS